MNALTVENDQAVEIMCDQPQALNDTIINNPSQILRPTGQWHIHKGNDFLNFVHIDDQGIQIDRYVKFRNGQMQPESFLMQKPILQDTTVEDIEDINKLLMKVDSLILCPGTGIKHQRGPLTVKFTLKVERSRSYVAATSAH